jgi:hypothetical protein
MVLFKDLSKRKLLKIIYDYNIHTKITGYRDMSADQLREQIHKRLVYDENSGHFIIKQNEYKVLMPKDVVKVKKIKEPKEPKEPKAKTAKAKTPKAKTPKAKTPKEEADDELPFNKKSLLDYLGVIAGALSELETQKQTKKVKQEIEKLNKDYEVYGGLYEAHYGEVPDYIASFFE